MTQEPFTILQVPRATITVPNIVDLYPRPYGHVSLSLPVQTNCKKCGRPFNQESPLVIDEIERPDLWARILAGETPGVCPAGHEAPPLGDGSFLLRDRYRVLTFVAGDELDQADWTETASAVLGILLFALPPVDPVVVRAIRWDQLRDGALEPALRREVPSPFRHWAAGVQQAQREQLAAIVRTADEMMHRFQEEQNYEALDIAIAHWNEAITHPEFRAADDVSRANVLMGAGIARYHRIEIPTSPTHPSPLAHADLDAAVNHIRDAVKSFPPPAHPAAQANLITVLGRRYDRRHDPGDLEELIGLTRAAADDPRLEPDLRVGQRSLLAYALWERYRAQGELSDLEEAIAQLRAVVGAGENGDDADRADAELQLGTYLAERHKAQGNLDDLREAQEYMENAAARSASAEAWNQIGDARLMMFGITGSATLLDAAVDAYQQTVNLSTENRKQPIYRGALGNALLKRWDLRRNVDDINAAVKAHEDAFEQEQGQELFETSVYGLPRSRWMASALVSLACALLARAASGNDADRTRANELLATVPSAIEAAEPETGLVVAQRWGQAETNQRHWRQAAEAYGWAQDLTDRLIQVQLGRHYKEIRLHNAGEVGARAAFALARDGRPQEAVAAFERARSRLLSDALERDRLDFSTLAERAGPNLAERYRRAAQALESASDPHGPESLRGHRRGPSRSPS